MLISVEKIILDIFIKVYQQNINNYINYKKENLNIILDNIHIPDKLINIFFKKTKNYLNIILETSILYSIGYETKDNCLKYLNYIDYYKEEINNIENLDNEFKRLTLYYLIKFLLHKNNKNIDIYKYDIFRNNNKEMLIYINNNIKIYTINDLEKIIIYKILCKYDLEDIEKTILDLTTTNKYDEDIKLLSDNIYTNKNDILYFKNYIIKKMIFDTYIIENTINKEIDDTLKENLNDSIFYDFIKENNITPIDKYIDYCITNNIFILPKDKKIIETLINRYSYCFFYPDKEQEYIENTKNKKELKKINPYYRLG